MGESIRDIVGIAGLLTGSQDEGENDGDSPKETTQRSETIPMYWIGALFEIPYLEQEVATPLRS